MYSNLESLLLISGISGFSLFTMEHIRKQFLIMVTVNSVWFFLFRKLSIEFRHFWVFVFYHMAYSKTRKPRKIFISSLFKIIKLYIWFKNFSKHFMWSGHNSQNVAQSYQRAFISIVSKWLFWLLKPKWFLDNILIAF